MNLCIAFFLSFLVMLLKMHYGFVMHPFIPFLVLATNKPFITFIWLGFLCGTCVDVFSSYPFGLVSLIYTATAFFLSFFKKSFSEKKTPIFFINSLFASAVFSIFYLLALSILTKEITFSFSSLAAELIFYCPLDALIGLLTLYFPLWAFEKSKQISFKRGFLKKRRIRG